MRQHFAHFKSLQCFFAVLLLSATIWAQTPPDQGIPLLEIATRAEQIKRPLRELSARLSPNSELAPIVSRLIEAFETHNAACAIAVETVPTDQVSMYGIVKPATNTDVFEITDLIEKPKPEEAPSNLAIAGRYVFAPALFDAIKRTGFDHRGEIQLTNAIRLMLQKGMKIVGVKLPADEKRYDIGNFESYFETFVEFALTDPVYGEKLRQHVKELLGENF